MFPSTRYPTPIPNFSKILHGGDYNPDQWLNYPEVIDEDFRLMPLAGCNTFAVGIFAWTSYEAEEGKHTFDWLDRIMDRMAKQGNKVILATPSGAKPAWMAKKYPEIRRVGRNGLRAPYEGRHNHCWTSPVYREKVRAINTQLAQRYGKHPALGMWHLSNEYSGECMCDLCLGRWQGWLKDKYKTLDAVNHAHWTGFWSHNYTDWSEIEPRDHVLEGMMLDWMRFNTWQMIDFMEWEMRPLRELTPGVPCTTNFMGTFNGLNYAEVAKHVDVVADDQYPRYDPESPSLVRTAIGVSFKDDLYRAFKKGRPFFLMESCPGAVQWSTPQKLKRPGVHRLEMLQAIAHGADGTCYFQWRAGRGGMEKFHGAVVEHVGNEHARGFKTVVELGKAYEKMTPVLGTGVKPQVAIIYDWESRWAQALSDGVTTKEWHYDAICHDHYEAFWRRGIPVDVISPEHDLSGYKLVIAPRLWIATPELAQRWRTFVESGGTLVATHDTAITDPTNLVHTGGWPGVGLKDLFGIWIEETDRLSPETDRPVSIAGNNRFGLQANYNAHETCALGHLCGATTIATYATDFYAGRPALTVREAGKGQAIYQAARFKPDLLHDLYGVLIRQLNIEAVIDSALPSGVTAQVRGVGDEAYIFLLNFTNEPRTVSLGSRKLRCIETGQQYTGSVDLGALEVRVCARVG